MLPAKRDPPGHGRAPPRDSGSIGKASTAAADAGEKRKLDPKYQITVPEDLDAGG